LLANHYDDSELQPFVTKSFTRLPAQIGNAAGIAAMGAVYFAVESVDCAQHAVFVVFAMFALSIMTSVAFLSWMRRALPET
jgi:hypothetical protein